MYLINLKRLQAHTQGYTMQGSQGSLLVCKGLFEDYCYKEMFLENIQKLLIIKIPAGEILTLSDMGTELLKLVVSHYEVNAIDEFMEHQFANGTKADSSVTGEADKDDGYLTFDMRPFGTYTAGVSNEPTPEQVTESNRQTRH